MSLIPALLQAIVSLDGEALVIHVGEKPYVVAPVGQVELATRGLTLEAVAGILDQLLPSELQRALDEFGAIQHELPSAPDFPHEHFTVVAARGGDDVWLEIRRRRISDEFAVPLDLFETPAPLPKHDPAVMGREGLAEDLELPDASHLWSHEAGATGGSTADNAAAAPASGSGPMRIVPPPRVEAPAPVLPRVAPPVAPSPPGAPTRPASVPPPVVVTPPARVPVVSPAASPTVAAPPASRPPPVSQAPATPGVVLPIVRNPVRPDTPLLPPPPVGLDRLLRIAAARGAATLYLSSQSRPSLRVDGEIQVLDGEPALEASDVESLLLDLVPERDREALRGGAGTEWISTIADVGRVRCMTFRDHRGPGGIFRMMPHRALSADQLGLSPELQALAYEPEGLVLVGGPRSSGKTTLVSGFVDLINRGRRDHVVTIESEIKIVHEHRSSFISQREVRGSNEEMLAAARAAMREDPDVLVIEELRTADLVTVALDAAGSGRLVIGALPAHNATGAVDRIIDLYPPEYRRYVQLALAESLRGVVVQVLLRRPAGGRVAAREVLLNTPAVASLIADGKTSQLASAMDGGRRFGMVPLNDALIAYVQGGTVDVREAYRRAADRAGFLAQMQRLGLDTSFAERFA